MAMSRWRVGERLLGLVVVVKVMEATCIKGSWIWMGITEVLGGHGRCMMGYIASSARKGNMDVDGWGMSYVSSE